MKISVLVAARQNGLEIAEALASVRTQIHTEWELLVVEYDSADETQTVVRNFETATGRSVQYLNIEGDLGVAGARNRLLELAAGSSVAFLDPADRWTPLHLADAAALLDRGVSAVTSEVRLFDHAPGRSVDDIVTPTQLSANPARTLFTRDALPVPSSVTFRRDLVKQVGLFDAQFHFADTRDFWLRCALSGARFAATRNFTCHSTRKPSLGPAQTLLKAAQMVQFYEKHREVSVVPAALRRRCLSTSLVMQGRLLCKSNPAHAARCFWRAWSLQPMDVQTLGQFALTGWNSAAQKPETSKKRSNTTARRSVTG